MAVPPSPTLLLVIDVLDEELGLADVEDELGRMLVLPAAWLPAAHDGAAYHAHVDGSAVTFTPAPDGARQLRERSKQTLLDFTDEHGTDDDRSTP